MDDPAQKLYQKRSKRLDINRDVESFAMWSFGLSAGQVFLLGMWFLFPLFIVASIIAIIFGFVSISRINKNSKKLKGKGFAVAGIIIGFLQIVLYPLLGLLFVIGVLNA